MDAEIAHAYVIDFALHRSTGTRTTRSDVQPLVRISIYILVYERIAGSLLTLLHQLQKDVDSARAGVAGTRAVINFSASVFGQ